MTTKKTHSSRLTRALLETADDMRRAGVMDAATHAKITLRHLGDKANGIAEPITGAQHREVQRLQWFLSESTWDHEAVNQQRISSA